MIPSTNVGWLLLLVGVVALLVGALLVTSDKKHRKRTDSPVEKVLGIGSVVCLIAGGLILVINWVF